MLSIVTMSSSASAGHAENHRSGQLSKAKRIVYWSVHFTDNPASSSVRLSDGTIISRISADSHACHGRHGGNSGWAAARERQGHDTASRVGLELGTVDDVCQRVILIYQLTQMCAFSPIHLLSVWTLFSL